MLKNLKKRMLNNLINKLGKESNLDGLMYKMNEMKNLLSSQVADSELWRLNPPKLEAYHQRELRRLHYCLEEYLKEMGMNMNE